METKMESKATNQNEQEIFFLNIIEEDEVSCDMLCNNLGCS